MGDRIWTKGFVAMLAANTFIGINFYLLMTTMAIYAMSRFQASESMAGLATGLFVLGAVCMRIFAGKFLDLIGRKKMLYTGMFLFLALSAAYWLVQNLAALYAVRFLHGLAFGLLSNALMTIATSLLPASRRGEGTGYLTLGTAFATAIGPSIAIVLISFSYDWLFAACVAVSFVATAFILPGKVEEPELTEGQRRQMKTSWRLSDFIDVSTLPLSLLVMMMSIVYSSVMTFLNAYAAEKQLMDAASYFFVVYAVMLFVGRPMAGRLLDRKSENIVMYPAILLFAASFLLLAWANSVWMLLVAAVLLAFGFGTAYPGLQMIVAKITPPYRLGLALSTFFIFLDAGLGFGGYIIGYIAERIGFQNMFLTMAAVVLCIMPLYYLAHGRKVRKAQKSGRSASQSA